MSSERLNTDDPKPGDYQTLDAWRGLASLWVVMYHMTLVLFVSYPHISRSPLYTFSLAGSLGVQIFFVISGYCIANAATKAVRRGHGFGSFMAARVRRIYPPVWAALVFAMALSITASFLVATHHLRSSTLGSEDILHQKFPYFLENFTLTQCLLRQPSLIFQCWTLCYEMAFYLLIGLFIIPAGWLKERFPLLTALHAVTGIVLLLLILVPQRIGYPVDLWPEFGLGVVAYDVLTHGHKWQPKAWLGLISILIAAFCLTHSYNIGVMTEPSRLTFLFCLGFTFLLIALYKYEKFFAPTFPVRLLSALGLFSYSLYLTHVFSIGIVNQCVKVFHIPARFHDLVFAVVILAAIAFARLFFQFFERPFLGSVRKRIEDANPVAAALKVTDPLL